MKKAMVVVVVALCSAALVAQDNMKKSDTMKKSDAKKPAASMAMPMPTPAPEMTKLIKAMAGTWTVTEKHFPNPMMPNGGTGKGTATLTPGPGNLSLTEKYRSAGTMGSFTGLGVFWWDPKAQVYRGTWCDTMTPTGCDAGGTTKWEGDKLVGTMEGDMGGQKMVSRFTYSDWKPNSFMMTMEMGADTNSMKKAMEVTYTKGGASSAKMEKEKQ